MDSDQMKNIMGSTWFSVGIIVFIVAIGVALRLTFRSTSSEYKHKPDKD